MSSVTGRAPLNHSAASSSCRYHADRLRGAISPPINPTFVNQKGSCTFNTGKPCVSLGISGDTVHLATTKDAYELFGSSPISCLCVSHIDCGTIDKDVRRLKTAEVTEELLAHIETRFDLIVT